MVLYYTQLRHAIQGGFPEMADLLAVLEREQDPFVCLEALLDAPYGSVELISLEAWSSFAEEALRRMRWAKVKA